MVAIGVFVFAVALIERQCRRSRRLRRDAAAVAADAEKAVKRSGCVAHEALPVDVDPRKLPAGWLAAPPVYITAECQAVLPLVTPQENAALEEEEAKHGFTVRVPGSKVNADLADPGAAAQRGEQRAFLLCEGPRWELAGPTAKEGASSGDRIMDLLRVHPLLKSVVAQHGVNVTALRPAPEQAAPHDGAATAVAGLPSSSSSPPFTHMVKASGSEQGDPTALLVGLHGPYLVVAVLMGFPSVVAPALSKPLVQGSADASTTGGVLEKDRSVTCLSDAVAAIVGAAFSVPFATQTSSPSRTLDSGFTFPGTPAGAHQGQHRVTWIDGERTVVLGAPAGVAVRSRGTGEAREVSFEGFSEVTGERVKCVVTRETMKSLVASERTLASACLKASESASPAERHLMERLRLLYLQDSEDRLSAQSLVTTVYTHAHLRVLFSVHEETGVVLDPVLTATPQVLYFPLGRSPDKPCVTIQEFVGFPPTWETALDDDDELMHNVRFHFTEWDTESVVCTVTELSGLKCVQFTETKEGVACRSYVVPRKGAILVVRCEIPEGLSKENRPFLQSFMDTLHIDA